MIAYGSSASTIKAAQTRLVNEVQQMDDRGKWVIVTQ